MGRQSIAATWSLAFPIFALLAALTYAGLLSQNGSSHGLLLMPVLTPGAGLYVVLAGSLLFGRGFGRAGEAAVFIGGSAAAWATLLVGVILLARAAASRLRAPHRKR
jgi:hypothetical protein